MNPTIQLKPENMFTLVIGTKEFKNMQQVDTWENFIKLQQQPTGEMCILMDIRSRTAKLFADAFRGIFADKPESSFLILIGTHSILAAVAEEKQGADTV